MIAVGGETCEPVGMPVHAQSWISSSPAINLASVAPRRPGAMLDRSSAAPSSAKAVQRGESALAGFRVVDDRIRIVAAQADSRRA